MTSKKVSCCISVHETTIRPCPSPNKNASNLISSSVTISKPSPRGIPISSNVTNNPPSATSCADWIQPRLIAVRTPSCTLPSISKFKYGAGERSTPRMVLKYSDAFMHDVTSPIKKINSPFSLKSKDMWSFRFSNTPTMPMVGVGKTATAFPSG